MRTPFYLLCIGLFLACLASPALAATPIGGSVGAFNVKCPVDSATVWFDGEDKGKISNGMLMVPVYSTGTPYQTYRVEADGYEPYLSMLPAYPSGGQIVELEVSLVKSPIGGQTGTYRFSCNVEGAYVFMDGGFQGVIEDGALSVPVYTTGTPYKRYSVQASGYLSANGAIPRVPSPNEIVTIPVNLVARETPTPIGGDRGAYLIYCQVEGAMVSLDGDSVGTVQNGEVFAPVYTTGTPYKTLKVTASGYEPYSAPITRYPGKGEIVHLYAFLEPLPPATTAAPIGGDMGAYLVHSNAEGANVYFDADLKGQITNGVLNVPVYVTGTPYRTWSIVKDGFATFNGTISTYPAKGETIDLQAALTLLPTTAPTTAATTAATTTAKSPLSAVGITGALAGLALFGFAARRR